MAVDVAQLLSFTVKNNASDLHLSGGVPPMIRVDGDIKRINMPALTHKDVNSESRLGRRIPHYPVGDTDARRPRRAVHLQGRLDASAGYRPGDRAYRVR
jgi:hypothetical protein